MIITRAKETKEYILHSKTLQMGVWRKFYSTQEFKLIISKTLNQCRREHDLRILGYMITDKELHLVPANEGRRLHRILEFFYVYLKNEIVSTLKWEEQLAGEELEKYEKFDEEEIYRIMPLTNLLLIQVLVDEDPSEDYYQPRLAKIIDETKHNNFCSVHDYRGARGPVRVLRNRLYGVEVDEIIIEE